MTNESYAKIAANITPDKSASMDLRTENSKILIEVLKLLDRNAKLYDASQKLLAQSYYHWLPDYFFTTPASSTGKYHPAFANKRNGLMLHSLAVARIAIQLLDILTATDDEYKDFHNIVVCAAWLHDMLKYGDPYEYKSGQFTVHDHPVIAAEFIEYKDTADILKSYGFGYDDINAVSDLIRTHMGPYTTSKYSDVVLDPPKTALQVLLFQADFLASRKENDIVKDVMDP